MSIEISSDDSICSVINDDLPEIDFVGNFVKGLPIASGPQTLTTPGTSIVLSDDDGKPTVEESHLTQLFQSDNVPIISPTSSYGSHEGDISQLTTNVKPTDYNGGTNITRKRQHHHYSKESNSSSSSSSTIVVADINDDLFDDGLSPVNDEVVYPSKNRCTYLPSNVGTPFPSTSNSSSGVFSLPTTNNESENDEDDILTRRKKKESTLKIIGGKKACDKVSKEEKKRQLEKNKTEKRAMAEQQKCFKPGECMKYMYVEFHPDLFTKTLSNELQSIVTQAGAHLMPVTELNDPNMIMWTRRSPTKLVTNSDGQVKLGQEIENCDSSLLVLEAKEFSDLFSEKNLNSRVSNAIMLTNTKVTIVLYGAKEYLRKTGKKKQSALDEIKMEMALTDLIVSLNCCSVRAESPTQLAELVLHFTKAIAETPYKKAKYQSDEKADFYMRGDNRDCISVDKDGQGLQRWWQQMVARLPLSGLETARAICSEYPSPLKLIQALEENADGETKLAQLAVRRTAVPGAKNRKVGPGLARKVSTFLTATDGNIVLH